MFESLTLTMPIFMGLMVVIGLFITVFAFNLAKDADKCPPNALSTKRAARILISLGVFMVSMASTYLLCGCTNVGNFLHKDNINMMFVMILLFLGIFVNILVNTVRKGCKETGNSGSILLSLSSLVVVLSILYFTYRLYMIFKPSRKTLPSVQQARPNPFVNRVPQGPVSAFS